MSAPQRVVYYLQRGRLVRHTWRDSEGRVGLLAAMSPETADKETPDACPASVMPQWFAHLTLWIDTCTTGAWRYFVIRYAELAARWHVLDAAGWERVRVGAIFALLRSLQPHTLGPAAYDATAHVLAWYRDSKGRRDKRLAELVAHVSRTHDAVYIERATAANGGRVQADIDAYALDVVRMLVSAHEEGARIDSAAITAANLYGFVHYETRKFSGRLMESIRAHETAQDRVEEARTQLNDRVVSAFVVFTVVAMFSLIGSDMAVGIAAGCALGVAAHCAAYYWKSRDAQKREREAYAQLSFERGDAQVHARSETTRATDRLLEQVLDVLGCEIAAAEKRVAGAST